MPKLLLIQCHQALEQAQVVKGQLLVILQEVLDRVEFGRGGIIPRLHLREVSHRDVVPKKKSQNKIKTNHNQ